MTGDGSVAARVTLAAVAPLLRAIEAAGVPVVLIGSLALEQVAPELLRHAPRDCDVIVPSDVGALERALGVLVERGYVVTSWQEPVGVPLDARRLRGRSYLRARPGGGLGSPIVDLTYEPRVSLARARSDATRVAGVLVAGPGTLAAFLHGRDAPGDAATAARLTALS